MKNIIAQGAEAIITLKDGTIIKDRIKKSYRLEILDKKLRKSRTKKEAKVMQKISSIIPVPRIINSDDKEKIEMQYISGEKLSEHLETLKSPLKICEQIGNSVALLHDNEIIHGDLTTSNMIFSKNKVYFIDFGLAFNSKRIEDKAVDLHLLRQALEAKHFSRWEEFFKAVLKGYKSKDKIKVLEQLKKVESRGRYKH